MPQKDNPTSKKSPNNSDLEQILVDSATLEGVYLDLRGVSLTTDHIEAIAKTLISGKCKKN